MRPFAGDAVLFNLMKRELAAAVVQAGLTLIVSTAAWKLSTRNTAPPSGPVPPEAAASLGKGPPTRSGVRVLLVGPETDSEFQYAQKVNSSGGKATAVNPVKTPAAERFAAGGGEFVEGSISKLPKGAQFDIIREDFPYPTGKFVDTAGANERISRLKPGGSWVVVTEKRDFAERAVSTILRQPSSKVYCSDSTVRMSAVD